MKHQDPVPRLSNAEEQAVLSQFYAMVLSDREGPDEIELDRYLRRFPGYEALIRAEYQQLMEPSAAPVASSPSETAEPSEIEQALARDLAEGTLGSLADYFLRFPGKESLVTIAHANLIMKQSLVEPEGIPDRLGSFEVQREIGRGGQAVVYLARDVRLDRPVALKVMVRSTIQPDVLRRFEREAMAAAQVEHPNIASVYEVGVHEPYAYIAMAYVPGKTLERLAKENPKASLGPVLPQPNGGVSEPSHAKRAAWKPVVHLFESLARALHAAHEAGVIHRDIKPGNVMVTPQGSPVLLDFGFARTLGSNRATLTRQGDLVGTPQFMSPEQIELGAVDRRTDIYSLGVTLYECLAGVPAFHGSRAWDVQRSILSDPLPALPETVDGVPTDLQTILEVATNKEPAERYPNAKALADDLGRLLAGQSIHARPASRGRRLLRFFRRHRLIAMTALLGVVGGALAVWGSVGWWPQDAGDPTEPNRQPMFAEGPEESLYRDKLARWQSAMAAGDMVLASKELRATRPSQRGWEYEFGLRQLMESRQPIVGGDPPRLRWVEENDCWEPLRLVIVGDELFVANVISGEVRSRFKAFRDSGYPFGSAKLERVGIKRNSDQSIYVWDTRSGERLGPFAGHGQSRPTLTTDGRWMVYLAEDRSTVMVDLDTKDRVQLSDPVGERGSLWTYFAFDSQDQQLCTVHTRGGDLSRIQVHDMVQPFAGSTLRPVAAREYPIKGPDMVWHPSGSWIVFRIENELQIADPKTLLIRDSIEIAEEMTIGPTFHPDGVHLVTRHWDALRAWKLPKALRDPSADEEARLPFPEGEELALGVHRTLDNLQISPDGMQALVYCLDTRTMVVDLKEPSDGPSQVAPSEMEWPRSSAQYSATLQVRGMDSGGPAIQIAGPSRVLDEPRWFPWKDWTESDSDGDAIPFVACEITQRGYGFWNEKVIVWDLLAGEELLRLDSQPVSSMAVHPDGTRLVCGQMDGSIQLYHTHSMGNLLSFPAHGSAVTQVAFSSDGNRLYSLAADGETRTW